MMSIRLEEEQLNHTLDRVKAALTKLSPDGLVPDFQLGDADIFTNTEFFFESKGAAGKYLKALDGAAHNVSGLHRFLSMMSVKQRSDLDRCDETDEFGFSELSVAKIAMMQGITDSVRSLLVLMGPALAKHRENVCDEINNYWSKKRGRGKSWHAKQIALRIAQMYYDERENVPTFGVDQNGNPTTLYTSVVAEAFDILEIKVRFKEQAKWGRKKFIEQLNNGEIPDPGFKKKFNKTVLSPNLELILRDRPPLGYPPMSEIDEEK